MEYIQFHKNTEAKINDTNTNLRKRRNQNNSLTENLQVGRNGDVGVVDRAGVHSPVFVGDVNQPDRPVGKQGNTRI